MHHWHHQQHLQYPPDFLSPTAHVDVTWRERGKRGDEGYLGASLEDSEATLTLELGVTHFVGRVLVVGHVLQHVDAVAVGRGDRVHDTRTFLVDRLLRRLPVDVVDAGDATDLGEGTDGELRLCPSDRRHSLLTLSFPWEKWLGVTTKWRPCLQVLLLLWHSVGPNVGVANLRGNEKTVFQDPSHYPPTTDLK